jgi:hypothetical protein
MMDLCSEAADHQSLGLDEFVLVSRRIRKAGWGAHASSPTIRKSSPTANGSFVFASPDFREAPSKLTHFLSEDEGSKEGRIANSDQAFSVPPRDQARHRDQARRRKLPRPGAMAMAHLEEPLLNGRLDKSHPWTSRQRSRRTSPKAQACCAPIKYLRKEILPIPASQNFLLYMQVPEETWRTRRPPQPGKRKGMTSPPPGQKLRRKGFRKEKVRAIQ